MAEPKPAAAVTAITVKTERGTFLVLGAEDPRWHLKSDGTYEGIKAIENGAAKPLPLRPGFIGGEVNARETSEQAAIREIREEAGNGFAEQASKAGLHRIFVSLHAKPSDPPTTYYYHAHLKMSYDSLKTCLKQGKENTARGIDDSVALMLVRPEQIEKRDGHYVMKGPPLEPASFRSFVPISAKASSTPAQREAIALYNARGEKEPRIGIDAASLTREIPVYTPPGGNPAAVLSAPEIAAEHSFSHVSNGALLDLIRQRLQAKPPAPQRFGAALG